MLSIGFYKWWRESRLSRDVRMLERVVRNEGLHVLYIIIAVSYVLWM